MWMTPTEAMVSEGSHEDCSFECVYKPHPHDTHLYSHAQVPTTSSLALTSLIWSLRQRGS